MITITISGLPEMGKDAKRSIYRNCVAAICLEKDWDLTEKDFVFELSSSTRFCAKATQMIGIVVEGLPVKSGDGRVRNLFAHMLGAKIRGWFPNALIQVRVRPVNPEEGFWNSDRKPDAYRAVRQLERMLGPNAGVGDECLDHRRG